MNTMKDLVGHTVSDVQVTHGERSVRFLCEDGVVIDFVTDSECCSETWIAEVLNLPALVGHRVTAAVDLELPERKDDDGHSRQGYDQFYGFRIDTEAGSCTIVVRNSSNGFYGGSLARGTGAGEARSIVGKDDWTAYEASP